MIKKKNQANESESQINNDVDTYKGVSVYTPIDYDKI